MDYKETKKEERGGMTVNLRVYRCKAVYNQRMHLAETPFAIIKSILGVRRFLLRGLEKVTMPP